MPDNAEFRTILREMPDGWGTPITPAPVHAGSAYVPTCKRLMLYRRLLGWKRESWSEALDAGRIWHNVMALMATGNSVESAAESIVTHEHQKLHEAQLSFISANPDVSPPDTRKQEKAISLGAMMAHAWDITFPMPPSWEVLAVEQTIEMPLDRLTRVLGSKLVGTPDLVFRDTNDGKIWIVDHKSTDDAPSNRAQGLVFDTQCRLYLALWNAAHPDQAAYGFIHNIIQKPGIRQKKNETFDDYIDRCLRDFYDMKALKDPTHPPMIQSYVPMTSPDIGRDNELRTLLRDVAKAHATKLNLWRFPRVGSHPHGCSHYKRVCSYMPLCTSQPGSWYDILIHLGFIKDTTR